MTGVDAAPEGDASTPGRGVPEPGADDGLPVPAGRYLHYRSPPTREYEVLFEARHSETEERLVVYRALYGERGLWVRPRAMFVEQVEVDGERLPRFRRVGDAEAPGRRPDGQSRSQPK